MFDNTDAIRFAPRYNVAHRGQGKDDFAVMDFMHPIAMTGTPPDMVPSSQRSQENLCLHLQTSLATRSRPEQQTRPHLFDVMILA